MILSMIGTLMILLILVLGLYLYKNDLICRVRCAVINDDWHRDAGIYDAGIYDYLDSYNEMFVAPAYVLCFTFDTLKAAALAKAQAKYVEHRKIVELQVMADLLGEPHGTS